VPEVQDLRRRYPATLKPLQSIGYRQVSAYIDAEMTWAEMVAQLKKDTRNYAKRQLTWFRAESKVHWLEPSQTDGAVELLVNFFGF
jgi:tRNA dimethylallyltransferase